nr:hypothetical protein [Tanacetum cinerariifolium]
MEDLKQQYLDELKRLSNLKYRDEIKIAELKENFNDSFSIDKIDYVEASPPDYKLISSEVMEIVIPEETNTFDNSLLEFETFCFDDEEISSGSTTTHLDISLPEYKVFHDDHVKEISS